MSEPNQMPDRFIGPDEQGEPAQRADELFVHGLLGLLHEKEKQRERVSAAIAALGSPSLRDGSLGDAPVSERRATRHRKLRRLAALAAVAVLALAGGVMLTELSGGSSAYAVVSASRDAAKGPGQRRYELRLAHWPDAGPPKDATGTLDSAPGVFLLKFRAPDDHQVFVGKDDKGEWAIRLDGGIERDDPRRAWPHWAEVGDDSLLADSVDNVLESLLDDFSLTREGRQVLPGAAEGSPTFNHIHGDRKPEARRPQPDRVDLWIDPETKVLERLEMNWPKPPDEADGAGGPEDRPPPPCDRPEGRDGPGGPPPDGLPPRLHPRGPEDGPDGPPGPPDGPGMGRGGPPPDDRMGPGHRDAGRPGRKPISVLVLTRVEAPAFEDGWFSPEKHQTQKPSGKSPPP
jgi:hypothetical protein